MNQSDEDLFSEFTTPLLGLPVTHIWRGAGSAIFLEFGELHPTTWRDGSTGNPKGEWAIMIEWSWRVEGRKSILCGSWSDVRPSARSPMAIPNSSCRPAAAKRKRISATDHREWEFGIKSARSHKRTS